MNRDDLLKTKPCPRAIATFLLNMGGKNIHDEPNWRLVWAPDLLEWRGGLMNVWPEHSKPSDRGRIVQNEEGGFESNGLKPIRVEAKVEKVPKFPDDPKWVLQLWYPAHKYGSRETWIERTKDKVTGLPLLGPYPENGDYEVFGVFHGTEPPSITTLQEEIQCWNWRLAQQRGSLEDRIAQRLRDAEDEQAKQEEKEQQLIKDAIHDETKVLFSSSLEAGRHREALARRAGIKEHCGA